ncbi:hypothetical protein M8J76_010496 [Diaphorina citri]|nr:hypothetical protein M8J76_010496 [Diaphorina citri]KAI5725181.1 hypothetical protein M8J77_012176 [Diaphorina citri]
MNLFRSLFLVSLIKFCVLTVSGNLYESINALTEYKNGTEEETGTVENLTTYSAVESNVSATGIVYMNSVPVTDETVDAFEYNDDTSNETTTQITTELNLGKANSTRDTRKIKFNLDVNRLINSKRKNLVKRKMGLLNNANNLRRNLRRMHSEQRSLYKGGVDKMRFDIIDNLNISSSPYKSQSSLIPLMKYKIINEWNPRYSENVPVNSQSPEAVTKESIDKNNDAKIEDFGRNCTVRHKTLLTDDNRRQDSNVFDFEENSCNETSESPIFVTPPSDEVWENDEPTNFTHVHKERGMNDKFFTLGSSNLYGKNDKVGKKKTALQMITDKLKHVFPFLKGLGGKKGRVKISPSSYPTLKYDPKFGVYYKSEHGPVLVSGKSKPFSYSSSITHDPSYLKGSNTPIVYSDLIESGTRTKIKAVPVPYNVVVEKKVPYFVKIPYDNPVPYHISEPYGVPVEKIVPYPVRVEIPEPYPVTKFVKKPYNLYVENPVPVEVEQPYPVLKEQLKPYTVETVVNKPYLEPVYNDFTVALPYEKNVPVPIEDTHAHTSANLFRDDVEHGKLQPIEETPVPNDLMVSPSTNFANNIKNQQHLSHMMATMHSQTQPLTHLNMEMHPVNPMGNRLPTKLIHNEYRMPAYYFGGHRSPKSSRTTKLTQSNVPNIHSQGHVSFKESSHKKKRNRGLTEVQFLDLMKQGQTRDTMKQNQLLNEAFKHNLLHEEHMRTLLKQNQILKAKLRLAQEKMKRPHHHTKEYPEFKPIDTSLNLPVLQKDKYSMNHNNDQMDSQYSTLGTPLQSVNYQNVNQGTPPSYTDVVYQNVAQKPKTQSEIIDEHLRQLYSKNTHNAVEIVKSEGYSYQVPESSTPLSFYYVQNQSDSSSQHLNPWSSFSHLRDSDVGFSQSHEVFTPSNQDSELYRLQLEYRILENLMKNIEEKKVKSNQTTPDHDEKFVKNPNFNTIPVNKFSPDESLFTREPFHEESVKPHSKELGKVNNANFNNNVLNSQIQRQSEAVYANPNSWANLNNMDNYTVFLANVIKDSYATNKSNYEDTSNKQNFGVFKPDNDRTANKPILNPDLYIQKNAKESNSFRHSSKGIANDVYQTPSPQFYTTKSQNFDENKSTLQNELFEASRGKITQFSHEAIPFQVFGDGYVRPETHYGSIETSSPPSKEDEITKSYENYLGYFKTPLQKWSFKNNTAINYGKLNDFLDIMKYKQQMDESVIERRTTTESLNNVIFNDIQKHFGMSADMNAEGSFNINTKVANKEILAKNTESEKLADQSKKVDLNKPNEHGEQKNYRLEYIEPTKINSIVSESSENKTKKVESAKRRGSTRGRKTETRNTTETTFSDYSHVRRGKDIISENNRKPNNKTDISMNQNDLKNREEYLDLSKINMDSENNTLYQLPNNSVDTFENLDIEGTTDSSNGFSKNILSIDNNTVQEKGEGKFSTENEASFNNEKFTTEKPDGKLVTIKRQTSRDSPQTETRHDSHQNMETHQNQTSIFDLMYNKNDLMPNNHIKQLDFTEFEENISSEEFQKTPHENSVKTTILPAKSIATTSIVPTLSTITTTISKVLTPPSTTRTTTTPSPTINTTYITKSKYLRGRGFTKSFTSTRDRSENIDDHLKNTSMNETKTEFVPSSKRRRQPEKSSTLPSKKVQTSFSHLTEENTNEIDFSKVKNETNEDSQNHNRTKHPTGEKLFTKPTSKGADPVKNNSTIISYQDVIESKLKAVDKIYQKDAKDFRTIKIFAKKENTSSTTLAPSQDRVTVKAVHQIERIRIKNQIKEKLENTTKRNGNGLSKLSGFYNHKNSSDLLERRLKHKERFLSSLMITTTDATTTEFAQ